ncbi:MAG: hypothetical protein ACRDNY_02310, partial [Gaiellaceae bacterium]
ASPDPAKEIGTPVPSGSTIRVTTEEELGDERSVSTRSAACCGCSPRPSFGVLGPVAVWRDGEPVKLGTPSSVLS